MTKRFCFGFSDSKKRSEEKYTEKLESQELTLTLNLSLSPRLRLPQSPTIPGALRTYPIGRSTNRSNTMPSPLITLLSSLNIPNIRLERITPTPDAHLSEIPNSILSLSKAQMR